MTIKHNEKINEDNEINDNSKDFDLLEYNDFDSMNLEENLLRGIYAYGYEKPSNIQSKAIIPIKDGKDLIAQSQSGTGKTATFLIGSLSREMCTIIQFSIMIHRIMWSVTSESIAATVTKRKFLENRTFQLVSSRYSHFENQSQCSIFQKVPLLPTHCCNIRICIYIYIYT